MRKMMKRFSVSFLTLVLCTLMPMQLCFAEEDGSLTTTTQATTQATTEVTTATTQATEQVTTTESTKTTQKNKTTQKKKSEKKEKEKKEKEKEKKERKIEAPEDKVEVDSSLAKTKEAELKDQLLKVESYNYSKSVRDAIEEFYQALNEITYEAALPSAITLTGVKKTQKGVKLDSEVNVLLMNLANKTDNKYLKQIVTKYDFQVTGSLVIPSDEQDDTYFQLKPYLDEQLANSRKTTKQKEKALKKQHKEVQQLRKEIKELKANDKRVFDPKNLLVTSNLSVDEIKLMLKGTEFESLAPAYRECETKYGVNAVLVMAISIHESGWGTSRRAREDNNLTGYGVTSDSAKGINAQTKEENLLMTAKLLKEKYLVKEGAYYHGTNVIGVNQCYCVGDEWAAAVTNHAYNLMKKL